MLRTMDSLKPFAGLALIAALVPGCSIYKLTGNVMSSYAAEEMVPYMMGSSDVNMACQTGASLVEKAFRL